MWLTNLRRKHKKTKVSSPSKQIVSTYDEPEWNSDEETLSDESDDKPISSLKKFNFEDSDTESEGEGNQNNNVFFIKKTNLAGSDPNS